MILAPRAILNCAVRATTYAFLNSRPLSHKFICALYLSSENMDQLTKDQCSIPFRHIGLTDLKQCSEERVHYCHSIVQCLCIAKRAGLVAIHYRFK